MHGDPEGQRAASASLYVCAPTAELGSGRAWRGSERAAGRQLAQVAAAPAQNETYRFFMERGGDCPYGARANFAHGETRESARRRRGTLQRQAGHLESRGGFEKDR